MKNIYIVKSNRGRSRSLSCAALPAFCVALFGSGTAFAATINVNTTNMSIVVNGQCGFREALQAVNTQTATAGCIAGTGSDIINLPAGTYTATTRLDVLRDVEIRGAGVDQTIIRSNLASGSEMVLVQPSSAESTTVVFQDLTADKAAGQASPNVTGIYAVASAWDHSLYVYFRRIRVSGHTWGGLYSDGAGFSIEDSIIEGNTSPWSGAGVAVNNGGDPNTGGAIGSTNILNSLVANNHSDVSGGGIYHGAQGNSHLLHSTVSGNSSGGSGGGLWLNSATDYFQIEGSTIAYNSAANSGGGIQSTGLGNYYIFGNIVGNNVAHFIQDWDGYATTMSDTLVSDSLGVSINDDAGGNLLDVDPLLDAALSDLGGPYHTKVHRLLPGSPAIDHYSFELPPSPTYTDQRHFARGVEGDGVSGGDLIDIGAYEHDPNWHETEFLTVAAKSSDTHTTVSSTGYSTSVGTNLQSNADNDFVTYAVPVLQNGTYNVKVKVRRGNNRGRFQLGVSSSSSGPFTSIGGQQELYSASQTYVELNVSNSASLTAGTRYFRFLVNGKHASSSSRQLFIDYIKLTKL